MLRQEQKKNITKKICLWHSIPFNNPYKNVIWQLLDENVMLLFNIPFDLN